ncbi:unnamed protein product, partial [Iphiclides podalirius]
METVGKKQLPQGGTGNAGESTPRPSLGSPIVSGGGNTLFCGEISASSVGPLTSGDQLIGEGTRPVRPVVPARCSRGRRGRRGRLALSGDGGESDGLQLSLVSATSEDNRKRKAKAPSVKAVAAKYKAVAASASVTATDGEELAAEIDTEEDLDDLSSSLSRSKPKMPTQHGRAIEEVADRSRNLKGSFAQGLRLAVRQLKAAAGELARRSAADDVIARLEKENAELRSALSSPLIRTEKLTEEIKRFREQSHSDFTNVPGKSTRVTKHSREQNDLMEHIGMLIESKLMAFEARLFPDKAIRPPLGEKIVTRPSTLSTTIQQPASVPSQHKIKKPKLRKKKKPIHPPVDALVLQASTPAMTNSWADVTKKAKIQNVGSNRASRQEKRQLKVTRAPKSAAITITLVEGSTSTYAKLMEVAKTKRLLSGIEREQIPLGDGVTGAPMRLVTALLIEMVLPYQKRGLRGPERLGRSPQLPSKAPMEIGG